MKKIMLNCWAAKNLGDDLFLEIISNRYNCEFYAISVRKYNWHKKKFHIINSNSLKNRIIRKLNKIILHRQYDLKKVYDKKCDLMVVIGGSLFIENKNQNYNIEYLNSLTSTMHNYFILGSNIGPYKNKEYINQINNIVLNQAKDVCFRDYESKKICNNSKIRVAPDIVFSLNPQEHKTKEKKQVLISVIDCEEKKAQIKYDCTEEYEKKIVDIIHYYQKNNYEVILMSFCDLENDPVAIKRIQDRLEQKVQTYLYDGNINEALKIIAESEIIVGSRFHANILGVLFNKKLLPIAYNEKTTNTLNDLKFQGKVFNLSELASIDEEVLSNLTRPNLNLDYIREESQQQFLILDKYIERK